MISSKNKMINVKVSKSTYDFVTLLSKKYGVSVSSFCQDCITQSILFHDKRAEEDSNPEHYYKKLCYFINQTYDDRRK